MSKWSTGPDVIEDRIFIGLQHPGYAGPLEAIAALSTADPTPNPLADGGRDVCSRCGEREAAPGKKGARCLECITEILDR